MVTQIEDLVLKFENKVYDLGNYRRRIFEELFV